MHITNFTSHVGCGSLSNQRKAITSGDLNKYCHFIYLMIQLFKHVEIYVFRGVSISPLNFPLYVFKRGTYALKISSTCDGKTIVVSPVTKSGRKKRGELMRSEENI